MVWEYRVITFNTEYETMSDAVLREAVMGPISGPIKSNEIIRSRLEMEGKSGWELVSLMPAHPSPSPPECQDISVANPWIYHAIFKRPKEQ